MTKAKPVKLPDKPSALIRLALRDLEKCERSPKYKVEMAYWHDPNGKCKVCLAGSVMAKSLGVGPNQQLHPQDLEDADTQRKLFALNAFRVGGIHGGLEEMGIKRPITLPMTVPREFYKENSTKFKVFMRGVATMLAKEGL